MINLEKIPLHEKAIKKNRTKSLSGFQGLNR